MLEDIIEKVKHAEAQAEKIVQESYEKSYQIIQESKAEGERIIENAKAEAKAILKSKADEAAFVAQNEAKDILRAGQLLADKLCTEAKASIDRASDFIVDSIIG